MRFCLFDVHGFLHCGNYSMSASEAVLYLCLPVKPCNRRMTAKARAYGTNCQTPVRCPALQCPDTANAEV